MIPNVKWLATGVFSMLCITVVDVIEIANLDVGDVPNANMET